MKHLTHQAVVFQKKINEANRQGTSSIGQLLPPEVGSTKVTYKTRAQRVNFSSRLDHITDLNSTFLVEKGKEIG